jgi:putative polyketide hydroxylase
MEEDSVMASHTPVLIVGGSLNGLTTALLLAHHGIRSTVIERHPVTTVQYKFRGISPRSMEIYRSVGLESEIRAHRSGDQKSGEIARVRNLADPDVHFMGMPWADMSDLSATTAETCDQDRLEPLLRARAEALGAEVRFGSELVSFEESEQGVTARVRDLRTGRDEPITAQYLVAADGVAGRTREMLGIGRHGPGVLQHWMNLIFDTDLQPIIQGRRFTACFTTDINGTIVPREDRWLIAIQYQPERGERPEDFDAARTEQLVRRAAGRNDVRVRLFDARSWSVAAYVTDTFRRGRVFFVGDSAHSMPPTGGFGGNTGIHDAHNLAWKLAYVLRGRAGPALLDSYDPERRFVAERTLAQALARLSAWFKDPNARLPATEPILDDRAVIFGQVYPSSSGALVGHSSPPAQGFEDPLEPSGQPGTRAPHFMIDVEGGGRGVHDVIGKGFLLLTGSEGDSWHEAAAIAATSLGIELNAVRVGAEAMPQFLDRYRSRPEGAVLIRPDGFIAWRSESLSPDVEGALRTALERILDRGAGT